MCICRRRDDLIFSSLNVWTRFLWKDDKIISLALKKLLATLSVVPKVYDAWKSVPVELSVWHLLAIFFSLGSFVLLKRLRKLVVNFSFSAQGPQQVRGCVSVGGKIILLSFN